MSNQNPTPDDRDDHDEWGDHDEWDYDHDPSCDGDCGWVHVEFEEARPARRRVWRVLHAVLDVAFLGYFTYQVAAGKLDFSNGWAVLGGPVLTVAGLLAGVAVVAKLGSVKAAVAVALVTFYVVLAVLPESIQAGCSAGLWCVTSAICAWSLSRSAAPTVKGLYWRLTDWFVWGRHERAVTKDAARGLDFDSIDTYLTRSAEFMAGHTIAKMNGAQGREIIGLSGYAGAGKDTAARGLIYSRDYNRVSFADKLRDFALAQNPLILIDATAPECPDPTHVYPYEEAGADLEWQLVRLADVVQHLGWTDAKKISEVRRFLQATGTDAGRRVLGENVWVEAAMRDLPQGPVVFTDCRFPNEAAAIRDAGGYIVRVERPGVAAVNAHVSETALDEWEFDGYVINEGTERDAREQMLNVAAVLYDNGEDDYRRTAVVS